MDKISQNQKNSIWQEPPIGLFDKVMKRIEIERQLNKIKKQLAIFSLVAIVAGIASVFAFKSTQVSIAESGFIQFFSLLFSDFQIVSVYWQSFAWSLLESLPATNLLIFLASVLVLLSSLKIAIKDIKIIKTQKLITKNIWT